MITYKKDGILLEDGTFLTLESIVNNCNEIKATEEDLVILEFYWERRRSSDIYESRVYPRKTAERIVEMMLDKQVYFGEIEGKHSEVYGILEDSDVTVVDDKEKLKEFLSLNPEGWSYNHSFIDAFHDHMENEETDEFIEEFSKLSEYVV
jgi:hypothetical protein